ncbi:c-type cytochrome biogenesis protein CcsB [Nocardioides sp. WL0053]|uniref:C-type cytochrome biogenesis protein CcsB n=1 Tax=Nocardioides jiangsuensis TaxID=2866161 RepID=A0ABS7RHN7_9ACTN|nr:c-type cytochrome biogenesis protein CcsB [Nocardioides jiangsuensis]MBY9074554.1 c-type cytochrome biogenesis protein CcsB [Nocardioides jiangsuensis]
MSTADFAAFSNNAIAFASVVYVFAFVAHLAEWAFARSVPVTAPAGSSAVAAAEPVAVGTSGAPVTSGVDTPGGAAGASYDRRADEGRAEDGRAGRGPDAGELSGRALSVEKLGRIGVALTVLAALLHLAGLVTRGLGSDPVRVPWGNMYEFSVAGAFGVTLIYLVLLRKYALRWMGVLVTAFEVVVLMLAVLLLYVPAGPLVPALHSYWLVIHVVAAVIGAGAFAVGAMASALFLVKARAEARGTLRTTGYVARLPESSVLDRIAYRVHAFGFPIWTFAALVAGPIWAEYAWGRYWGWDPKEVWAFITWVVYAAYLHARATAGWRGKGAAVIALIGFATVLFNFVGINLFGSGLHSYSGLD